MNESDIIKALRDIPGCEVYVVNWELGDVVVGYQAHNIFLEIKRPGMENRKDQQKQKERRERWPGQITVVTNVDEALQCVLKCYRR